MLVIAMTRLLTPIVILLLLAFVIWLGISRFTPSPELIYIFPDGFRGIAIVRSNKPSGVSVKPSGGVVTLIFPASGILDIRGDDPIHDWHRPSARYVSGETIPAASANPDRPISDDVVGLRTVGSKGESADGDEETWYVVGTFDELKKAVAKMRGFEYR
jgi:hypothetical protein